MTPQFKLSFPQGQFAGILDRKHRLMAAAASRAATATAKWLAPRARSVIAAGGFGAKPQSAYRVTIYGGKGQSLDVAVFGFDRIPYFGIFGRGATIKGSPLLWLPLPQAPSKAGGRRITAGNFTALTGAPLFSLRRRSGGPPLLGANVAASAVAGGRALTAGQLRAGARRARRGQANAAFGGTSRRFDTVVVPLFVGIPKAQIRKRFDLTPVYREAKTRMVATFKAELA